MRAVLAGAVAICVAALMACSPAPSGKVEVSDASIVTPPPGAPTAAGYMKVSNGTAKAVRLLGGATSAAESVEIHEMSMDGGVMRMRQLSEGVEVPAGGSVVFSSGGMHLMLVGLKAPLAEGSTVPVTLTFDGAASIDVQFAVKAAGGHGH